MTVEDWLLDRLRQPWDAEENAEQYKAYVSLLVFEKKGLLDAFVEFIENKVIRDEHLI